MNQRAPGVARVQTCRQRNPAHAHVANLARLVRAKAQVRRGGRGGRVRLVPGRVQQRVTARRVTTRGRTRSCGRRGEPRVPTRLRRGGELGARRRLCSRRRIGDAFPIGLFRSVAVLLILLLLVVDEIYDVSSARGGGGFVRSPLGGRALSRSLGVFGVSSFPRRLERLGGGDVLEVGLFLAPRVADGVAVDVAARGGRAGCARGSRPGVRGGGGDEAPAGGEGRGSRIVSVVRGVPRFRRAGAKTGVPSVRWVCAPWREATGCARGRAGVFARVRVVARDADAPRASRERVVLARAFPSSRSASSTSTDSFTSSRASAAAATSPAAAALEIRQGHASRRHSRAADEAARRDAGASDDSGRG